MAALTIWRNTGGAAANGATGPNRPERGGKGRTGGICSACQAGGVPANMDKGGKAAATFRAVVVIVLPALKD